MFRKSFKGKIIFPIVAIIVTLVFGLSYYMSMQFADLSNSLVSEKIITITNNLNFFIINSRKNSIVAAVTMAQNPQAIQAIKKRDRNEMLRIFTQTQDLYQVNFYTITDNKGIALARTHESNTFGDSVLFEQNVRDALEGNVASYFEEGTVVKVSIRTGAPVYDADGKLIGAISAGIRFDTDKAIDDLKELFKAEVAVFFGNTRIATTIKVDGERVVGTKLNPAVAKTVFEEKMDYNGDAEILGAKYKAHYKPLLDPQGEVFAALALAVPMEKLIAESKNIILDGIVIGLLGLIVSITVLYFIVSSISNPVVILSKEMNTLADGSLKTHVNIERDDEVGALSKSLQKVINILRKLLKDINNMIAEQKKGNIEYVLSAEDFHGDYKVLVNNILELADIGARDQLTGIPNRRSFDNRLDLEWNCALREKKHLGVLMVDVDGFKKYNDTFGHQQGDLALMSVSDILKHSIKRPTDLTARWGGEEFIILLPDTEPRDAINVAERIRAEVEDMVIPCDDTNAAKVTVSIGVRSQVPTMDNTINEIISKADMALYSAKEAGRNKVVLSEEP
jgi:methyl-accepting chemotaxis protein